MFFPKPRRSSLSIVGVRIRDDFIRVQYAFRVHGFFYSPHQIDGLSTFRVSQVMCFRRTDPVLGADAPPVLGRPSVDERLDGPGQLIVTFRRHYVQM